MKKNLLIIAWEYEGFHSVQGTALSRRTTQVAKSFSANGWKVTVFHCDHRNESGGQPFHISETKEGVTRIAVKLTSPLDGFPGNPLFRKLETLYYVALKGDKTSKWAKDVIVNFNSFGIVQKPDFILAFYEPRASLLLGNYFSKKLGVPWIADVQDPILEGISKETIPFGRRWVRSTVASARAVVHISPEWAEADAKTIGRPMLTIRHAIPQQDTAGSGDTPLLVPYQDAYKIFYGGSLTAGIQSLSLLSQVLQAAEVNGIKAHVFVAGNENCFNLFRQQVPAQFITHLGWLSREQMNQYILGCDCTAVIPWSKERIGIPSKFYELCIYPKPVWIIGNDLGAFDTLLKEWQHLPLPVGDPDFQLKALTHAANGDPSLMFRISACKGTPLYESGLYVEFVKLMQ